MVTIIYKYRRIFLYAIESLDESCISFSGEIYLFVVAS